ncbi:CCR4-NOT transcription complex subunit 9 [Blattella germanica]|nr:CCR4-NOT transcription complex subunit 9 [Blattella germanica]
MSSQQSPATLQATVDRDSIYQWIVELSNPDTRENALLELSKKREVVPDLAPMLWHSFGTIAALLQEIINIYPAINPATLTAHQSNRVCNALALLQCVASHPETRSAFLQAHVPLFLYPFLHTVSKTRPFEYLRLTSLGVIGALVKGKMVLSLAKDPSARLLKHVDDKSTKHWLSQLLKNLEAGPVGVTDPRSVGISPLGPQ